MYNSKISALRGNFKVLEETDQFHSFVIMEFLDLKMEKMPVIKRISKASSFRKNESGLVDLIFAELGDAIK